MKRMAKLRSGMQLSALAALGLTLCLTQNCARSEPLQPPNAVSAASSKPRLPFHPETGQASTDEGGQSLASADPKLANGLPFRTTSHPRTVPAGTLLTVDLQGALSTNMVHSGDVFIATVAAPLTIDGETIIERGTTVTGRVESARSQPGHPGMVPGLGYFRLTLSEITVDGKSISLQTSSLFAKGTLPHSPFVSTASASGQVSSNGLRVQKGRSLTFRLIAPVTIDDPNSVANRQYAGRSAE